VDYRLQEAARAGAPQVPGLWAEPDVAHAAALMRQVFEDRSLAGERGAQLGRHVREHFGEAAVIERLQTVLQDAGCQVRCSPA
jgi:hypothetical protein